MSSPQAHCFRERLAGYVSIARPDHWTKHVFIIPGILLALALTRDAAFHFLPVLLGMASACLLASANYTINEWLDAETDKFHPTKKNRPSCNGIIEQKYVTLQYVILCGVGLGLAACVNTYFFITSLLFLLSGILYNVKPFRTKDKVYLDVLTESLNNPIRLMLGWFMVSGHYLVPLSILLCFYFGGTFLMSAKRLSEYRHIVAKSGSEATGNYRRSFRYYTENSLIVSCFTYAVFTSFLAGVFLIKYRVEYILTLPLLGCLFGYYFSLALQPDSVAQKPEKLFCDKWLMLISLALTVLFIVLSVTNIPWLHTVLHYNFGEVFLD